LTSAFFTTVRKNDANNNNSAEAKKRIEVSHVGKFDEGLKEMSLELNQM
jgi:hypothetical protein